MGMYGNGWEGIIGRRSVDRSHVYKNDTVSLVKSYADDINLIDFNYPHA